MRIGIVGAGNMGQGLARHFAGAGHDVVLANSRGADSLQELVGSMEGEVRAGGVADAVAHGEVVFLAVPYVALEAAVETGGDWSGRIVVDLTNYDPGRDGDELDPGEHSSSVMVARYIDGSHVVKAFNTIYYVHLAEQADPGAALERRRAIPLAGDEQAAKQTVAELIDEIGFAPVDAGGLADSWRQEPGTPVYNESLNAEQVPKALAAAG